MTNDVAVLKKSLVQSASDKLAARKGKRGMGIHSQLTGYLAAVHHAQGDYSGRVATTDMEEFCRAFLAPKNATPAHPYFAPWTRGKGWFGSNFQGSYAPGSPRTGGLPDAMNPEKESIKGWSFKNDHADQAVKYLLGDDRAPGYLLAIYLLRDCGFPPGENVPERLRDAFREEFGLSTKAGMAWDETVLDWTIEIPDSPFSGPVGVKA